MVGPAGFGEGDGGVGDDDDLLPGSVGDDFLISLQSLRRDSRVLHFVDLAPSWTPPGFPGDKRSRGELAKGEVTDEQGGCSKLARF